VNVPDERTQPELAAEGSQPPGQPHQQPTRRAFLTGAGAAAVAGLAAACSADDEPDLDAATSTPPDPGSVEPGATLAAQPATIAFTGEHQQGVLAPPAAAGVVAAFDVISADREVLAETMQALSAEVARLMTATPAEPAESSLPPSDSGAIGVSESTAGVAVTIAVGASLFDERFGLADQRPRELIPMPRFFNDRLVQAELSHGDLALTISGPNQQAAVFALHQIVRVTERRLRLRWVQEGYNHLLPDRPPELSQTRNLMGFRDGTSNPDSNDDAEMDRHVWVQSGDGEPAWATGGSYQAVRVIRMLIEFWATAALVRQEQIFGRERDSGAPLGQENEADEPRYSPNPGNDIIPGRAHMRLANPRNGGPRILRRGFSYLNGAAADGTMDQGLLFLCFQRSLETGFLGVQSRLDGEPLEDYIKPVGGGLFFVLPGPGDQPGAWIGQSLLG